MTPIEFVSKDFQLFTLSFRPYNNACNILCIVELFYRDHHNILHIENDQILLYNFLKSKYSASGQFEKPILFST